MTAAHSSSLGAWRADERRPPLFLAPGASSSGRRAFSALSGALGDDWPVCVLASPASDGKPYTIEEVARRFTRRVLESQPAGPYVLGGYCFGGVVAYEVARQLLSIGHRVRMLMIIDAPRPGYPNPILHAHVLAVGSACHIAQALRRPNSMDELKSAANKLLRHVRRCGQGTVERAAVHIGTGSNVRAMRMYRPKPLRVPALIVVSRSHHLMGSPMDRRIGWLRCIHPRPALAAVGGDHDTILRPDCAGEIARHVIQTLRD